MLGKQLYTENMCHQEPIYTANDRNLRFFLDEYLVKLQVPIITKGGGYIFQEVNSENTAMCLSRNKLRQNWKQIYNKKT
jgi:hypothetical protein